MNSIDQRVVQMKFDNAQFGQGIKQTLADLQTLNKSLKLEGAAKGFTDLNTASQNVHLGPISSAVQSIEDKFRNLSIVGIAAITNITNKVVDAGFQLAKSLSVTPITAGLHEYETNLNSIQTILANTGLSGSAGLNKVNAALSDLNHYSDQTIYNFSEMARNIGTFTAAGVKLDVATSAIKGIANLAALSGSNAQQASSAMYQLSQALAAGKVTLEDWNSVVSAGMGGKVFQNALIETARVHGVSVDKIIKDEGSFRLSLQKGWLTSGILTETLSKFTGDLNAKQLKTMGYNDKQIAGILKMAKVAKDAATKVKTFSQLTSTLQEAVGSGWAQTWQLIFGDFDEAKKLWTGVNKVLGGFISTSAQARNKVLGDWKALGGRTVLIQAISNAFHALIAVIKPIKDAFRQIFPATTGKQLYDMTVTLRNFTEKLKIGGDTADKLKRTFAGVFAVFGIGWDIVKGVASTLAHLFGVASGGSGSFLEITAKIGDFLVALRNAIHNGDALSKFFGTLGKILALPIKLLQFLGSLIAALFDGFSSSNATKSVDGLTKKLGPLGKLGQIISAAWGKVFSVLDNVWNSLQKLAPKFTEFFSKLGSALSNGLGGLNFGDILSTINTGLFAGLVLLIKKFVGNFKGSDIGGGIVDAIKAPFEQLTSTLSAMQNTLKATTLLQIALAIGILTLSVSALSKIDAAGLTRALTAMTVMFTQLFASMAIFNRVAGSGGFAKMTLVTGAMILLAIAVDILASAVKKLAGLDWNGLTKGLTGVTVLLGGLVAAVRLMPNQAKLISSALGLVILAGAIRLLVNSVTALSGLSWGEMAKGLIGVGALLGALTLFTKFSKADKGGLSQGVGLILLATGIKILASAMKDLGQLSWTQIAKGLVSMGIGLSLMAGALDGLPPSSILSAAALLIAATSLKMIGEALQGMGSMSWGEIAKSLVELAVSLTLIALALNVMDGALPGAAALIVAAYALNILGDALGKMGQMSWGEIAKSLFALAGSLTILAVSLTAMLIALPGAAALLVAAGALAILAPVLVTFGNMSWESIGKSLVLLAGGLMIISIAGVALLPAIPGLIGLGIATLLIGVGMAAAGAGVFLFASGLALLAVVGAAATIALVAMVAGLASTIPLVMTKIGEGVIAFAKVIATAGPAITTALVTVLSSLIDAIVTVTPKIVNMFFKMLTMLLDAMLKYVPKLVDAGLRLVVGFLNGVAKNIGKVVTAASNVVIAFLNGIGNNLSRVIQAGVNLIIKFVNGIAGAIRKNSGPMGAAGANLASAIIEGMARGLLGGLGKIASIARSVANSALTAAKHALGIKSPSKEFEKIGRYVNDGFRKGLDGNKSQIDNAFDSMKKKLLELSKASSASARERAKGKAAYKYLTKYLDDEHSALGKLATKYDKYTAKIKAANDALAAAKKTRDDYNTSIKDQFSQTQDVSNTTRLPNYTKSLKKQIADTQEFATDLQKLRDMGLDDTTYKKLLSSGTAALPFIRQLLSAGKDGISQINNLDAQLNKLAVSLGKTASTELYQAAVDAAAGLVKGLQKQQAAIEKQMDKIAEAMVNAIKKRLHIKSPSKVFAEIGGYSAQGLADGLKQSSYVVEDSAKNVGDMAINSLSKSLANMSDIVGNDLIDVKPTITPVLDLTDVKKNADQIGSMLTASPISVDSTYSNAKAAYDGYQNNQAATDKTTTDSTSNDAGVTFNQYNTSPKALTPAEIYRQTKNQLSVAKEALAP